MSTGTGCPMRCCSLPPSRRYSNTACTCSWAACSGWHSLSNGLEQMSSKGSFPTSTSPWFCQKTLGEAHKITTLKTAHWECHRRQDTLLQGVTVLLKPTPHPRQLEAALPISWTSPTSTQVHQNCSPAGSATHLHCSKSPAEAQDTDMAAAPAPQHLQPGNTPTTPADSVWNSHCYWDRGFPNHIPMEVAPRRWTATAQNTSYKKPSGGVRPPDQHWVLTSSPYLYASLMPTILNILMSMNWCCKSNNTLTLLLIHFVFCRTATTIPLGHKFP